jgi:peptidoglycan-N-acetylglucosamine deacetylase
LTIVVHGPPERERFALTFDDGPERGVTERLLDVLDQHQTKATFFCVGEQVERDPGLGREIVARGHEVGSHTMRHRDHHVVEQEEAVADMEDGARTLERLLEIELRLYRSPYGHFTDAVVAEAEERGMTCVLWSALGLDWFPDDGETIAARVFEDLMAGAIVLLHDSASYTDKRSDCTPTIEATALVLGEAERRGLRPVTVGQLLALA